MSWLVKVTYDRWEEDGDLTALFERKKILYIRNVNTWLAAVTQWKQNHENINEIKEIEDLTI